MPRSTIAASWLAVVTMLVGAGTVSGADGILSKIPRQATAFIVIDSAAKLDGEITELIKKVMPPQGGPGGQPPTDLIKKFLRNELNVESGQFDVNAPMAVIFLMTPKMGRESGWGLVLKPVDFKALVGQTQPDEAGLYKFRDFGDQYCLPYNGYVLVSHREFLMSLKDSPPGVELPATQKRMADGADIYGMINLAEVMTLVEPEYKKARRKLGEELASAKAEQGAADGEGKAEEGAEGNADGQDAAAEAAKAKERAAAKVAGLEMALKWMDKGWGYARELRWAGFSAGIGPLGVDLQFAGGVEPEGQLAVYLTGHPPIGETLSPDLPKDNYWCAAWYSLDVARMTGALKDLVEAGSKGLELYQRSAGEVQGQEWNTVTKPLTESYVELLAKVVDLGEALGNRGASVALKSPTGGLSMKGLSVIEVKDVEAYRKSMADFAGAYKKMMDNLMKMTATMGPDAPKMDIDIKYEKDVQKVGDLSVDRLAVKINWPDAPMGPGPDPAQIMKQFFGGDSLNQWLAYGGGYAYSVAGEKPDALAKLVEVVRNGGGLATSPDVVALRKQALPQANVVAMVSISTYVDTVVDLMLTSFGMPAPPPQAAGNAPVPMSVMSLGLTKGEVAFKMHVPVSEIQRGVMNVMKMQMAIMQMQQRRQLEMERRMRQRQGQPDSGWDGGPM
ncbi:MAG: hypothetical protein GWP05_06260 [Anaerolineaceae bacterium]|nr:hypothetical protein [Anaerolineaceae bacterium]